MKMNMKKTILSLLVLAATSILMISCGDDDGPTLVDPVDPIIASFGITAPVEAVGVIAGNNIGVTVPAGTDITNMTVNVVVPVGATVSPESGSSLDFSSPVTFTVTGNDNTGAEVSADYTVTVEVLAPTKIGFLSLSGSEAAVTETDELAALNWFKATYGEDFKFIALSGISSTDLADVLVLNFYWDYTHDGPDTEWGDVNFPRNIVSQRSADAQVLKSWVENGGQLILAGTATQFVAELGLMTESTLPPIYWGGPASVQGDRPADDVWTIVADGDAAGRAVDEFGTASTTDWDRTGHPLFSGLSTVDQASDGVGFDYPTIGLNNATTREDHNSCWDLNNNDLEAEIGHTDGDTDFWARADKFESHFNATILAQWGQVTDFCCAMIIEFHPDTDNGGSVIAIGPAAYDWDTSVDVNESEVQNPNQYESNVVGMTENAVDYLSGLASDE
jgi:hypothetical protein